MAKPDPERGIFFANYTRFVVLAITTLCLTLIIANTLSLNFTIICMVDESLSNDTTVVPVPAAAEGGGPKYDISRTERSALFSAIAIGTIIGTIPITYFTSTFGVRKTFAVYGLISAVATVLTPLAASIGFIPLFGMRILQGFALSTSFPAMGAIISEWSAIKGSGMYIALLSCHLQFGPILTMPVSGEFCGSSVGWPAVYYLQGALTILSFIAFYIFFRDSPRYHRNVSAKELSKIEKGKAPTAFEKGQRQSVPYRAIFTDPCAWGIFVSNLGGMLGFQIFMQYGPIYLNKVLNFDVQNTGFAAALPYVLSVVVKVFAGPFSDRFTFISEKSRVILFATLSQFLMAACFIALAFMPTDLPTLAQTCFTGATVFSGLNCVGVAKSAQMVSRQYAHVLMAINAFTNSFIILLLPGFVTLLAPNNSVTEWARIFICIAVVVIVTTIWFDWTAEVEPRPWTLTSGKSSASTVSTESHESHHRTDFDKRPADSPPTKATFVLDPSALEDPTLTKIIDPVWQEIREACTYDYVDHNGLRRSVVQPANERPGVIVKVYKQKVDWFVERVKCGYFGEATCWHYVIEFQMRGLPHCHALITMADSDKPSDSRKVDSLISAEIPDTVHEPEVYERVKAHMIHGPCRPDLCLNEEGKCNKKFPKDFRDYTDVEVDSFSLYKRANDGRYVRYDNGYEADNSYVVPYNKRLLLELD